MIRSSLRGTPIRGQNHRIQIEVVTAELEALGKRLDQLNLGSAMIRSRTNRLGTREAFLYAFDPLELHGHDLRDESCHVRQAALNKLRDPAQARSR